ncbi:MAG: alcohol dehydrogenase catalytic domain-containing protein, partial [Microlunatus sp.]|nr:alcohol dehydrogenase catalytic domain-containing protein [Microlunatus sp.]
MLACVIEGAGKLSVAERPTPEPGPGEVAVDIAYGGVCGSDLHYYHDGAAGEFVIREPLVVGHEVVGTVGALGPGVTGVEVGTPVAVHPAQVCGACPECTSGRPQLCASSRYLGSAAHFPHIQGGFTERLVIGADRAVPLPPGMSLRRAALSEPFSVAYHAVLRAGDLTG